MKYAKLNKVITSCILENFDSRNLSFFDGTKKMRRHAGKFIFRVCLKNNSLEAKQICCDEEILRRDMQTKFISCPDPFIKEQNQIPKPQV